MGCVSSKHMKKDLKKELLQSNKNVDFTHHVVSLTSSTYGALKLEQPPPPPPMPPSPPSSQQKISPPRKSHQGPPEIINAWELMEDLVEDPQPPAGSIPDKKSPKLRRGFAEIDVKTPMKFLNQLGSSPKVASKRFSGKENSSGKENKKSGLRKLDYSPRVSIVKASTLPPNLRISKRGGGGSESPVESGMNSARRRNLGPLFDPDPIGRKKFLEKEQIKKMVSGTPAVTKSRNSIESRSVFENFEKRSSAGGVEDAVVIYTTTLRGIRKTFEDCNAVRGIIGSHNVRVIERDVSMDSGFKEEVRALLGKRQVTVPIVLVKGRLIGGSDEIMRLEEEGKLGNLLDGIPRVAEKGCDGCGGVRFVMCTVCNGSCKLIGGDGRRSIKCLDCNENGLVQCSICC